MTGGTHADGRAGREATALVRRQLAVAAVLVVVAAAVATTALLGLVDWSDLDRLSALPYLLPVLALAALVRAGRTAVVARRRGAAAVVDPPAETAPAAPRADVDAHDRFVVTQALTLMVNRYEVATAAPDGRSPGAPVCFVQQKRMALKEDLRAWTDRSQDRLLFRIRARQVFDVAARYRVTDEEDRAIGALQKVFERSLVRSTWRVYDAGGEEVAWAQERSVPVAVWRRLVDFVPLIGELLGAIPVPYHFDIHAGDRRLGGLERRLGLRDRYVLDLAGDPGRTLDRRLAIALAVGLDALQSR